MSFSYHQKKESQSMKNLGVKTQRFVRVEPFVRIKTLLFVPIKTLGLPSAQRNYCSSTEKVKGFRDRMLYLLFFFIMKPMIRLCISYLYLILLRRLFNWCDLDTLCSISQAICLAFNSNSLPTGSEDSFGINVLLESSSNESQNSLEQFRAQNAGVEGELFSRIRDLESQLAHGLPPQLNPGEYENLVRTNLTEAVTIRDYQKTLGLELFDIQTMELKVSLQHKLFNVVLAEPRLNEILHLSPFSERNIRPEIYDFIEEKVEPLSSSRYTFQRNLLEATLRHFIRDIDQNGSQSLIYRELYAHFTDEEFRQRLRDP